MKGMMGVSGIWREPSGFFVIFVPVLMGKSFLNEKANIEHPTSNIE
jgi:hypothetical protein